MALVFVDANIPMYARGRDELLRESARAVMQLVVDNVPAFVTDSEVLQEILRRYRAQRRWPEGRVVLDSFVGAIGSRVEPVYAEDVLLAADLADIGSRLDARDLLHAAVMRRLGCTHIVSADRGFDEIADVERLDPRAVAEWAPVLAS